MSGMKTPKQRDASQFQPQVKNNCEVCHVPKDIHGTCCGWINAAFTTNEQGVITDPCHPYFGKTYNEFFQSTRTAQFQPQSPTREEVVKVLLDVWMVSDETTPELFENQATAILNLFQFTHESPVLPTREEIVKMLRDVKETADKSLGAYSTIHAFNKYVHGLYSTAILSLLQNAPGKWVRVEDRLPENKNKVMIFLKGGTQINFAWYNDMHNCWCSNATKIQGVTHWQPLPEKPNAAGKPGTESNNK